MQNSEEVLAAMTAAVNEVIENRNTELFKSLDELKKKYTERNKTTQVISD